MDVSDRGLQAKLTQEAKITSACFLSEVIFAFGGFVNALGGRRETCPSARFAVYRFHFLPSRIAMHAHAPVNAPATQPEASRKGR